MDTKSNPKVSVCVPIHDMENGAFFLRRLLESLEKQTFKDFEIVITKEGKMAENTNAAIRKAKGQIIKILFMDDYLAHPKSLQRIVNSFKSGWLATGCAHDDGTKIFNPHTPSYEGIRYNRNTIGSPSVIAFENKEPLLFDEQMSWLLDVDYYRRLYERYGEPTIVDTCDVTIGIGDHQMTNILTYQEKLDEHNYFNQKYGN